MWKTPQKRVSKGVVVHNVTNLSTRIPPCIYSDIYPQKSIKNTSQLLKTPLKKGEKGIYSGIILG